MWSKLKGWFGGGNGNDGEGRTPKKGPKARWLEPDDPGNPFGVRLLDLMENLSMLATTQSREAAARAVGWKPGMQGEISISLDAPVIDCELRFPSARNLPEGLIYRPTEMEDKWVLVYRSGVLAAARSWTGETGAVAQATLENDTLVVRQLRVSDASGLDMFGDPVRTFEWMVRTHALGERIPLPVSVQGAEALYSAPLAGFSLFGRHLFCAAVDYTLGESSERLVSDGDLVAAVASGDETALDALLSPGVDVDAPCSFGPGAPALHLAIHLHPELVERLLEAGASVESSSFHGSTALMAACSAGAEPALLKQLLERGADLKRTDKLGFTPLHVAAQFGRDALVSILAEQGADIEARTKKGHAPQHIAAGNGHLAVLERLMAHGMDMALDSPGGTILDIANAEGHTELVKRLRALG